MILLAAAVIGGDNSDLSWFTSNAQVEHHAGKAAAKGNWIELFNGRTLQGWHNYNETTPVTNWAVEDGILVCKGATADAAGGDLVTDKEFENFELSWEWKIAPGGNSGVLYHVVEDKQYKAAYETGPEYQLIDDTGYPGKLEEWQKTGCDYGMNEVKVAKRLNPPGDWNTSKIVFNKGHVEHWLNGEKILEFNAWSEQWRKEKNEGKWKDYPGYGNAKKGRIALQDHGDKASFRNIKIKEL